MGSMRPSVQAAVPAISEGLVHCQHSQPLLLDFVFGDFITIAKLWKGGSVSASCHAKYFKLWLNVGTRSRVYSLEACSVAWLYLQGNKIRQLYLFWHQRYYAVTNLQSLYLLFFYYGQWQSLDGDSGWLMQTLQIVQLCISGAVICREITPGKDSDEKLKC
jgi:hypothetical protein